ncbi:MAG: hypothetical protein D6781_13105 [Verrucomicrobia bacterium]|nr:MAG: hypothetical protein D6781_13105 [Verrucomicrobiota bacterium]
MNRPIIVLSKSGRKWKTEYLGEENLAAEEAYQAAVAAGKADFVGLYTYPEPRLHCEPAAARLSIELARKAQRDPVKEAAAARAAARIAEEERKRIEQEELAAARAAAQASSAEVAAREVVGKVVREAVATAAADAELELSADEVEG